MAQIKDIRVVQCDALEIGSLDAKEVERQVALRHESS
jgi:hypothetical protein